MDLRRIPDRLTVFGGGYVGLEFAQMFAAFGSRVTVLERGPRLLPREDPDIAEALTGYLRADGVELLTGVTAEEVVRDGTSVTVLLGTGGRWSPTTSWRPPAGRRSPGTWASRPPGWKATSTAS